MIFFRLRLFATLTVPFLAAIVPALATDSTPKSETTAPKSDPQSIPEWTVEFLGYMQNDRDEQSAQAHIIHTLALEKGLEDLAVQCQPFMRDWRQTMALYEMAGYEATRDGKTSHAAQTTFERAQSAPIHGNTDSQAGRILVAKAGALAAMGKFDAAREVVPLIAEPHCKATATANLLRHAPDDQIETILKEIDGLVVPEAQRQGWKLAADRFAKTGNTSVALDLYRKILASAETHNNATTIAEVEPIVQPLFSLGDKESAKRAAALCLAFSERTSPQAGWKTRDIVLAGKAMRAIGQEDRAKTILADAPRATGGSDLYQFVRMGGWAATGFLVSGQEQKFDLALRDVIVIGRQHDHHRARALAVLQVLALLIESGRPLAPIVGEEIAKSARSIQIDPHSPVNSRL